MTAYPAIKTAEFKWETKDGVLHVTVIKKAAPKGHGAVLDALRAAPEAVNPAILMERRLRALEGGGADDTFLQVLALAPEIRDAISQAEKEVEAVNHARRTLGDAPALASHTVPVGM